MDRVQEIWLALHGERLDLAKLAARVAACDDLAEMMGLIHQLKTLSATERKLTAVWESARRAQLGEQVAA